jgi:predicted nucleic acid-binding protein
VIATTTNFAGLDFRLWRANLLSTIRHEQAAFSPRIPLSAKQIDVPLPKDLPAVVDTQVVAELARAIVKKVQKADAGARDFLQR